MKFVDGDELLASVFDVGQCPETVVFDLEQPIWVIECGGLLDQIHWTEGWNGHQLAFAQLPGLASGLAGIFIGLLGATPPCGPKRSLARLDGWDLWRVLRVDANFY